ncbi:MAG: hypothetical protein AAF969_11955, partial [Bacteroidota bacterium]
MEHHISEDITLTPIHLDYVQDIFEGFDKDVIQYLPLDEPPSQVDDTRAFVEHSITQMASGNDLVWVILYQNSFAGCCGRKRRKSTGPYYLLTPQMRSTQTQARGD